MKTYDDDTHTYTDDNGYIVPSVTEIMGFLCDYSGIDPGVLERKSVLGKAVHKACEYLDRGTLDWDSLDEKIAPYVQAWVKFKLETHAEIIESEMRVDHNLYRYAGRLDRVAIISGARVVIDIKCTSTIGPHVGVQLAGYDLALNRGTNKRAAVQLKPNGAYKYVTFEDAERDNQTFIAALTLHNWRLKHAKT